MSTTIDQKVVEMRFDNKQFESNVKTTMSTLDRLKQSLNLTGASKGLENVNATVKNMNFSNLSNSVEKVGLKFNALYTIADQSLRNIVNSAQAAGKKIVSAFTIDPIKTGFQEYETQINAVQTILANTQKEGTNVETVNAALDELNKYADMTIYNFTEMTRNIGTFTAAGVKLDTSVNAIQGIANLAAVSGSTSQQASTAMYQLSQALATGTVKLMDWNSVVNAGMGGQVFQDALKETSKELNTGAEAAIKAEGSFRESLRTGWLTSEVLTETLKKFTTSGANEKVAEYTGLSVKAVEAALKSAEAQYGEADAIEYASKALAEKSGKSAKEIKQTLEFAKTAEDAATKVKTFTQLMDTLKEAAQSGWSQTWRLIIGDFEGAKGLFTDLSDRLSKIINDSSEARNKMLSGALNSPWEKFSETIAGAGISTDDFKNKVQELAKDKNIPVKKLVKEFGSLEAVIAEGKIPTDLLKDALKGVHKSLADLSGITKKLKKGDSGKDITQAQKALKQLGFDLGKFGKKADGIDGKFGAVTEKAVKAFQKSKGLKVTGIVDEKTLAALEKATDKASTLKVTYDELVESITKKGGRELLIESLTNVMDGLGSALGAVKKAWDATFDGLSSDELYGVIERINELTGSFKKFFTAEDTVDKLTRTFKGLFAILDIITTITGGALKTAIKIVCKLFGMADVDILSVTASLGDMIVKFRDFLFENNLVVKGLEKIVSGAKFVIKAISDWIGAFLELPKVQKAIENFKSTVTDTFSIGKNIIEGLINGIRDGSISVVDAMMDLGKRILEGICKVLGIHSPSVEFFEIGKNVIQGFINGIQNGASIVWGVLKNFGAKCIEVVKSIDFGAVFIAAIGLGSLKVSMTVADALKNFSEPFGAAADFISKCAKPAAKVVKNFAGAIKSFSLSIKAEAIKKIAISIAILAGSIFLLSFADPVKLWNAVGVVAALAIIMGVLALATNKLIQASVSIDKSGAKMTNITASLITIGVAMLLMAATMKIVGKLSPQEFKQGGIAILAFSGIIVGLMAATRLLSKGVNVEKIGSTILKISGALLAIIIVAKIAGKMKREELIQGGIAILAFSGIIVGLMAATRLLNGSRNVGNIGSTILKVSSALLSMLTVAKIAGRMNPEELKQGVIAILAFSGIIVGLMAATKLISGSKNVDKIGGTILKVSGALLVMVITAKIASMMKPEDFIQGTAAILAFSGIIVGLMAATKLISGSKNVDKIGGTIFKIAGAIAVLAVVAILLSLVKTENLIKGIAAIGALSAIIAGLIFVTKFAKNCVGNIVALTVAIGVMALAIGLLSFIDPTKLAGATIAIGVLMGIFIGLVAVAGKAQASMGPLIVMTVAIGVLGGMLYLIAQLPIEQSLGAAAALSILLIALSASLMIVGSIGAMATSGLVALGVMVLVVGVLAVILYKLQDLPTTQAIGIAIALSTLLLALSAACLILAAVGATGPAAYIGVGALVTLIAAVGGLMVAIGALSEHFPKMEEFLDKGIGLLEKIGYGLGSFFGNIVGGFAAGATAGLPEIGTNLSMFMLNATPFITGAKMIDESMMNGVKALAQTILILTATDVIQGLTSWLTGGSSIADFATELVPLGTGLKAFSNTVSGIDVTAVTAAANAAKALAEMTATIPNEGGVVGWFAGENSISKFGAELPELGKGLKGFADEVSGMKPKSITAATKAAKTLAEMTACIPNEGGVSAWFAGENSISRFASQLTGLGIGLKGFADEVEGVNVESVTAAANAAKSLALMTAVIPNEGGVKAWFTGDNSISKFGDKLPGLGEDLKGFADKLSGITVENITAGANAAKTLAEMTKTTPKNTDKLESFGNNLVKFGDKLSSYYTKTSSIKMEDANKAAKILKTINEAANGFNSSKLSNASKAIDALIKSIKGVSGVSANSTSGFVKSLNALGKISADSIVKKFKESNTKMNKAGKDLITQFEKGAKNKESDAKSTLKKIVSACATAAGGESVYNKFKSAGANVVAGFAKGISANTYKAEAKAKAMANAAEKAAKKALDEHSPSKVFYGIGDFAGKGFVNALADYETKSYTAGADVANNAKNGLSNAIGKIRDLINGDIDMQPTIRPVLDLSDVESGAGLISGMFNGNTIGMAANVGAISTMMNQNQNGINSDVVSAINKLRKDISGMDRSSYTINGVTYDDGSNIADAVQSIVRAARVERRI